MEIVWHGQACFRLRSREITILTDPLEVKAVGHGGGKSGADIVTFGGGNGGRNQLVTVSGEPKYIAGPGEYEIRGVFITGIQSPHDPERGKKRIENTIYLFEMDDLVICHLGDLSHPLTAAQAEAVNNVDILLVPVGMAALGAAQAAELINLVEPKIIIPMQLGAAGDVDSPNSVERFCRELGVSVPAPQPKLVVSRSALPEEPQVVVLEHRKA